MTATVLRLGDGPPVEVRETHSGIVLLCGGRALKAKKPVVTDFLDFGSVEKRQEACEREVRLNRRLAPAAYLGVGHLGIPGEPPEPIVVMARLPDDRKLAHLLERYGDGEHDLTVEVDRIAALVARFHRDAERGDATVRCGTSAAVWQRWRANLAEMAEFDSPAADPGLLTEIGDLAGQYIAGRAALFDERIAAGRIVDGHGDLSAEDTFCMPDGPLVLDCLDFDDALRGVDGIDDIAFLAMDLEFRGHPASARRLVSTYLREAADCVPGSLIEYYIAYRAVVRAKVDLIRDRQGDPAAEMRARSHLRLACEHLRHGRVRLGMVGGLPGTGKSTVAGGLAAAVGAVLLSSDDVRHELQTAGTVTARPAPSARDATPRRTPVSSTTRCWHVRPIISRAENR